MRTKNHNTHRRRCKLIRHILTTAQNPRDLITLPTVILEELAEILADYARIDAQLATARAKRLKAVEEDNQAITPLRHTLRAFYTSLTNRTRLHQHDRGILELYGHPATGGRPPLRTKSDTRYQAQRIIAGEVLATAQGYPPTTAPSVAEIEALLTPALHTAQELDNAKLRVAGLINQQHKTQAQADRALSDVTAWFNYQLRALPKPEKRRIMTAYGFTFRRQPTPKPKAAEQS